MHRDGILQTGNLQHREGENGKENKAREKINFEESQRLIQTQQTEFAPYCY
jgi:hypothetical protein